MTGCEMCHEVKTDDYVIVWWKCNLNRNIELLVLDPLSLYLTSSLYTLQQWIKEFEWSASSHLLIMTNYSLVTYSQCVSVCVSERGWKRERQCQKKRKSLKKKVKLCHSCNWVELYCYIAVFIPVRDSYRGPESLFTLMRWLTCWHCIWVVYVYS